MSGQMPDVDRPRPGPPALHRSGLVFDERGTSEQRFRARVLGQAQREVARLSAVLNALGAHGEADLDLDVERYSRQLVRALRAIDALADQVGEVAALVRPPSTS